MPRQARHDSPGTLHHVMGRGIEKRRIVDARGRIQSRRPGRTEITARYEGITSPALALTMSPVKKTEPEKVLDNASIRKQIESARAE